MKHKNIITIAFALFIAYSQSAFVDNQTEIKEIASLV